MSAISIVGLAGNPDIDKLVDTVIHLNLLLTLLENPIFKNTSPFMHGFKEDTVELIKWYGSILDILSSVQTLEEEDIIEGDPIIKGSIEEQVSSVKFTLDNLLKQYVVWTEEAKENDAKMFAEFPNDIEVQYENGSIKSIHLAP